MIWLVLIFILPLLVVFLFVLLPAIISERPRRVRIVKREVMPGGQDEKLTASNGREYLRKTHYGRRVGAAHRAEAENAVNRSKASERGRTIW